MAYKLIEFGPDPVANGGAHPTSSPWFVPV